MPPIYQPEVAARAIVWAAEHPRRELWVGWPDRLDDPRERLASGVMDRYLGRTNVEAQQAPEPIDPATRPDNLFAPPPGDPGAHGPFDDKAHARSPQLWLATHKRALAAAAALTAGAGASVSARAQPEVAVGVELDAQPPRLDPVLAQLEQIVDAGDVAVEVELRRRPSRRRDCGSRTRSSPASRSGGRTAPAARSRAGCWRRGRAPASRGGGGSGAS